MIRKHYTLELLAGAAALGYERVRMNNKMFNKRNTSHYTTKNANYNTEKQGIIIICNSSLFEGKKQNCMVIMEFANRKIFQLLYMSTFEGTMMHPRCRHIGAC